MGASASWAADYRTVWQQNFDGDDYASGWSNTPTQSLVSGTDYAIIFGTGTNSSSSSISFSGNTSFSQAKVYAFEFDYGVRATHYNGGENLITMNSNNGTSKLFTISTPKGSTTTTVFNAAGVSVCTFANESYTNPASLPSYMYHFKVTVDEANGAKLTVTNSSSEKLLDDVYVGAYGQITGVSVAMGKYWATVAFNNFNLSYDLEQYTLRATNATATYSSISSSVMNPTEKTALDAAYSALTTNYDTADKIVADIAGYISAIAALETANANAQTSINKFAVLNDLIGNASDITGYAAPTGAESVFASNPATDVDTDALEASVRAAIITAGTANENTDITALIANSSFELGNTLGWTTAASDDTGARENTGVYATTGGDGTYLFNTWGQGTPITQTIGTLPAGQYTLTCLTTSSNSDAGGKVYLTMNGNHNDGLTNEANTAGAFFTNSYTFTLGSTTEVTIGAVGAAGDGSYTAEGHWWYKADKFTLTYNGEDPLEQAKVALNDEIDAATTVKDAWTPKVGTTPFKYARTYYDALVTELGEAATVAASGSTTVSDYTTALSELQAAKTAIASSTINEPDADKLYRLYLADGGTSTGLNMNLLKGSMQWMTLSASPYAVKIVKSGSNYIIKDAYDKFIAAPSSANSDWGTYSSVSMSSDANKWEVSVQEDGTFKMLNCNSSYKSWGWYLGAFGNTEGVRVSPYFYKTSPSYTTWLCSAPVDVTDVTLSVNATAGWGTFIAPYDNLTPSTVKAYTVSYTENNVVYFTENETGVLSANTPYILSTEEAEGVSTTFKGIANNDENTYTANGLVGLLTASEVPADSYVLQYNGGKVGFYKTTEAITGTANRCYLDLSSVPTEASSRATIFFDLFDSETAGIAQVEDGKLKMEDCLYNLNGQRISKPAKGLYIVNGKKVIIK